MLNQINDGNNRYIDLMRERERRDPREQILSEWLDLELQHEREWRQDLEAELIALSCEVWLACEELSIEGIDSQQNLREGIIALKDKIRRSICSISEKPSVSDSSSENPGEPSP